MDQDNENSKGTGHSRRSFLKGMGGAIGGAALMSGNLVSHGAEHAASGGPAARAGIQLYPAGGATIKLNINGSLQQVHITPAMTLLDVLREQLDLTGSKEVCGRGACGACTVLIDGKAVNGCMVPAIDAIGAEIITVEGLVNSDGTLHPVQQAFVEHDACQCGYCIPGFVVRTKALLDETPKPTLDQVKHGLSGNICRCAAYVRIFEAAQAAGKGGA